VLILDEPASGLDPRARVEIRELLGELANMGKTIFFSSHILADVEDICSHIGIIEAGQIIMEGSIDELKRQLMETRELIISLKDADEADKVMILMNGMQDVNKVELLTPRGGHSRVRVEFTGDDDGIIALNRKLNDENIAVIGLQELESDLEHMFMRVTKGLVT
jgi:ABC-2 type transport system ATP-binding protein